MAAVQAVARSGITVCATVHSPSAYAFRLFDSLLMLLRGRTIYFGPQGKPALEHFLGMCKTLSHCRPFEIGDNPAEWLVDVTTGINE